MSIYYIIFIKIKKDCHIQKLLSLNVTAKNYFLKLYVTRYFYEAEHISRNFGEEIGLVENFMAVSVI